MPQAIERLLATPRIRPRLPAITPGDSAMAPSHKTFSGERTVDGPQKKPNTKIERFPVQPKRKPHQWAAGRTPPMAQADDGGQTTENGRQRANDKEQNYGVQTSSSVRLLSFSVVCSPSSVIRY